MKKIKGKREEMTIIGRWKRLQGQIADLLSAFEGESARVEKIALYARQYAENIVDTVREPLIILDKDLMVISANRSFYQTFKVNPGETEGRLLYDLGNRQWDIPALRKLLEEILPENTAFNDYEVEHNFPDIGQKIMLLNARQIYRKANKIEMILLVIEDITKARQMEEELKKDHQRLEEMVKEQAGEIVEEKEQLNVTLRSIGDGVISTDSEGRVVLVNKVAENLTGFKEEEAKGKPLPEVFYIVNEQTRKRCENPVKKALESGAIVGLANDTVLIAKDGTERVLADSASPIRDKKGNIRGVVLVFQDITERKRTREKLADEYARAEMYLDLLGHNINNLNAAVVLYSELLLKEMDFPEGKYRTYLEKSLKQTMAISQLISNVHKLSSLKGEALETEDTDLFKIIALESVQVKDSYPMRRIKINHSLSESEVIIKANELLNDVVANLLDNAVKYCRCEDVVIDISHRLSDDGRYWKIEFKDNGPGICEEMKERVFARLVREKEKEIIRGSGLGLTLVREITTGLGGKIWVEDRVKGDCKKGSNFVLLLPKGGS